MNAVDLPLLQGEAGHSRAVSIRYFSMYRILVATAFALFGVVFSFGQNAPEVFVVTLVTYWVVAFAFFLLHAISPHYGERTLGVQSALDIIMLALFMYASGGLHSGIPFLMMTSIAGAGLVGQGRMVLGSAALATIALLADQGYRTFTAGQGIDFSQAAIISVGFFAVAVVARMLARRALANEALARARGFDLQRNLRVNARIIEDMQDGVVVVDQSGVISLVNPRAGELLGAPLHAGDRISRRCPALVGCMKQANAEGDSRTNVVLLGKSLSVRGVLVADQTEDSGDVLLYVEDMDRILERAQQIKLAALGRLTANMAHEIRNPLSAVSHAAELLLEENTRDVQERLVRIIRDNSARIDRMIRDVLELGKRDRMTTELIDLVQFCRNFIDEYSLHAPGVATLVCLDAKEDVVAWFDRVHLYQILSNLIGNASRYCSGQPDSIVLTLRCLDDWRALISVRDDGPGIKVDDRNKVFEPFFTSDPKGTGLGLYMARELAEANGAELSLVDAPGSAEFHLLARRTA